MMIGSGSIVEDLILRSVEHTLDSDFAGTTYLLFG